MKKVFACLLATALSASLGVPAFAADANVNTAPEVEPFTSTFADPGYNDYSYSFTVSPGADKYLGPGRKYDNTNQAGIQVEYASGSQQVYYRVCSAPSANSFVSETKWANGPIKFGLTYTSSYNRNNLYLRLYGPAGNAIKVSHRGGVSF